MDPVADQKKALRSRIAAALRQMSPEDRRLRSARLAGELQADELFQKSRTVFCYVSMPEEFDTHGLIRRLLSEGRTVLVPRVLAAEGVLEARRLTRWEGSFVPGPFGILEPDPGVLPAADPAAIDCVIVPGLAFDREGYRLGRGKGYYDKFLSRLGRKAARIAPAFECQRVDRVPREPHDEKVDRVLFA